MTWLPALAPLLAAVAPPGDGGVSTTPLRPTVAAPFDTAGLPAGADTFLHVEVRRVMEDPLTDVALPGPAKFFFVKLLTGGRTSLKEVEGVTAGFPLVAVSGPMIERAAGGPGAAAAGPPAISAAYFEQLGVIVRLREPWDADPARAAALLADAEERETDGVRWFALPPTAPPAAGDEAGGASPPALGVWPRTDTTLVLRTAGAIPGLIRAAAAGEPPEPLERPGSAGLRDAAVTLVVAPPGGLADLLPLPVPDDPGAAATSEAGREPYDQVRGAAAASVSLSLGEAPGVTVSLTPRSPGDAAATAKFAGLLESAGNFLADKARDVATAPDAAPADRDGGEDPLAGLLRDVAAARSVATPGAGGVPADAPVTLRLPLPADLEDRVPALMGRAGAGPARDAP